MRDALRLAGSIFFDCNVEVALGRCLVVMTLREFHNELVLYIPRSVRRDDRWQYIWTYSQDPMEMVGIRAGPWLLLRCWTCSLSHFPKESSQAIAGQAPSRLTSH